MSDPITRLNAALGSRYRIESELGEGGMATVYLAEDIKHERQVALKVLKPELAAVVGAERFLHEIQIAAKLNHPHILTLIDSGEADGFLYYVMPYVQGESLRDKLQREKQLAIEDALAITQDVASAMAYAHAQGVIHRDLKPGNILLHEGEAMVADFGLALALHAAGGQRLTETGLSLGTPEYMSPEQATADHDVDARSDIYSLAAVLYELLAGEPPHTGHNTQAIIAKLLTERPTPLRIMRSTGPEAVDRAVMKALAKVAPDRFATTGEFAKALAAEEAVVEVETKSIVVLPFANLSPDPDNEYFADGLTDEITTDLSRVQALRVISHSSAMRVKNTEKSMREIANELSCTHVLEGTVRRAGGNLRITAKLVETGTDTQVWADKYGGTIEDVFEIQETVSRAIVDALQVKLSPKEEAVLSARPIDDVRAQECYLRAKNALWSFTPEGLEEAIRLLEQGLDLVGNNVTLQRGLCEAYFQYVNSGLAVGREEELLGLIDERVAGIFAIDPDSLDGHYARVLAQFPRGDIQEAARSLRRVLEAHPNDTAALLLYGHILSWYQGRADLAKPVADRLIELDPLSPVSRFPSVAGPLFSGDFEGGLEAARRMLELDPSSPNSKLTVVLALYHLGRYDEAEELCRDMVAEPDSELNTFFMGIFRAMWRSDAAEIERLLAGPYLDMGKWDQEAALWIAQAYAVGGKASEALDWLETAVDLGVINYPYFTEHDPALAHVRGEERFKELMVRVKREWESFEV